MEVSRLVRISLIEAIHVTMAEINEFGSGRGGGRPSQIDSVYAKEISGSEIGQGKANLLSATLMD